MNDQQRAAFEAWYGIDYTTDVTLDPSAWSEGKRISWEAWQAALESPEVQALRDALQSIEKWEPPYVLSKNGELVPMSVEIGRLGERDYFRNIARVALAAAEKQK